MKSTEKQKEYFKNYYIKNKKNILKKSKEYRIKNPNMVKEYCKKYGKDKYLLLRKKSNLKINYNITIEEYNEKLKQQNYCCDICNKHKNKFKRNLHVDHDHKTNKVRGLLCASCNTKLSVVENRLEEMLKYLNKYRKDVN
jgi:hypothetical protein